MLLASSASVATPLEIPPNRIGSSLTIGTRKGKVAKEMRTLEASWGSEMGPSPETTLKRRKRI